MKIKFSMYEDKIPCLAITAKYLYFDCDFGTPWYKPGVCLCIRIGRKRDDKHGLPRAPGFTLDIHDPLGAPNRLYLWGPKRHYMIGLIGFHRFKETGRRQSVNKWSGRPTTMIEGHQVLTWPHLIRGQAWDWKKNEGTNDPIVWRWIVIHPNDYRERYDRTHKPG